MSQLENWIATLLVSQSVAVCLRHRCPRELRSSNNGKPNSVRANEDGVGTGNVTDGSAMKVGSFIDASSEPDRPLVI